MHNGTQHGSAQPDGDHFQHAFDDPEESSKRFDAPERDEWQMPEQVIAALKLAPAATVAEIGCGTGYFAVRLAQHLNLGKVIGLDAEPNMVAYLQKRAESLGLANLEARRMPPNGQVDLPEKVDLIFSVDTYHHLPDRAAFFARWRSYLKAGGRLVVIDRTEESPRGQQARPRVAAEVVKQELLTAGFKPVRELDFLPYQYFLVFEAIHPAAMRDRTAI